MKNFIYIIALLVLGSCSSYQKIIKDGTPIEKLEAARKYYKNKDYVRAQPLLEELLGLYYSKPKQREEIYYLYAYSFYGDGMFLVAGYHFNNFVQTYPLSPKKEEASYMSALCQYKKSLPHELDQSPTKDAINSLQAFINKYPNSTYVSSCNEKIDDLRNQLLKKVYENAKLYYSLGYYKSAVVSCTNAIEDYPDMINREELSYLIVNSAFLYAQNSIKKKQIERYKDAITRANQFRKEFSNSKNYKKEVVKIIEKSTFALSILEKTT